PACSRAIVDEAHQLEDIATQYFGFSVSNYRFDELARDVARFVAAGGVDDRRTRDELAKAIEHLGDPTRAFFAEVAFAHRGDGRVRNEERIRATSESLGQARDSAADLTGDLDILEATLALLRSPAGGEAAAEDDKSSSGEDAATLARRAGQLRDELRFLLRGGDDQ